MSTTNSSGSSRSAVRHRLTLAFQRSGLTQDELARRCGAAKGTVSDWFNVRKDAVPDGEKMARLPEALGVSGHWLLTGEGPTVPGGDGAVKRAERTGARSVLSELERVLAELRLVYQFDEADLTRAAKVAAHEREESRTAQSMPGRRRTARSARRRAS